jgi:hypothetical protein
VRAVVNHQIPSTRRVLVGNARKQLSVVLLSEDEMDVLAFELTYPRLLAVHDDSPVRLESEGGFMSNPTTVPKGK